MAGDGGVEPFNRCTVIEIHFRVQRVKRENVAMRSARRTRADITDLAVGGLPLPGAGRNPAYINFFGFWRNAKQYPMDKNSSGRVGIAQHQHQ